MMQAKENQQQRFDIVKENILPPANTKGIQGKMIGLKENGNGKRQSLKPIKNEIVDGKIKKVVVPKQNCSNSKATKKARKSNEANVQKAPQNKEPSKALQQSGKPVLQAKPIQQSIQQSKPAAQQSSKPAAPPAKPASKKETELDFVIFCDENDELAIKAVEKENVEEKRPSDAAAAANRAVEKKKGLAERNVKPAQQQQNVMANLQAAAVNQQTAPVVQPAVSIQPVQVVKPAVQQIVKQSTVATVTQTITTATGQVTVQSVESHSEILKETVVPINNLTLDETLEEINITTTTITDQSTIENKENDPTLMSIDLASESICQPLVDQHKDVSGDMCCREFSNEIYLYMLERELKFLPDPAYMSKQPEINGKMRAMLVDWLIDVGIEYELENETVFLAVSYIDQFLSSLTISLQNFQLLGTAALFIASKYEEIYPPELNDFIFVTDDAYTKLQMLSMEKVILKSLNFNVSPPTIFYFLKYFLTKLSLPIYVQHFAEYLCFLSLLHTDPFLSFSPSDIAISSIILALHTYTLTDVVSLDEFKQLTRVHFCKNEEGQISDAKAILIRQSCVNAMYKMQKGAADDAQQAVYTKYGSEKYLSVASVEIADEVPLVENFFI